MKNLGFESRRRCASTRLLDLFPFAKALSHFHRSAHGESDGRQMTVERLEPRQLLAAEPIITEFMARNNGAVNDGDGNSPDWIEVYNAGNESVDLAGYRLTDDPDNLSRWVFPSVNLDPQEYLVVFASAPGRDDYVDARGNLHTNFALGASGEYLALVAPEGMVLSEFGVDGTNYPHQRPNHSYGVAQQVLLVDGHSEVAHVVPTSDHVDAVWTDLSFGAVASGFTLGRAAIGYEANPHARKSDFSDEILTTLAPRTHAVYARAEFHLQDTSLVKELILRMKYDNGFVAYLNGVKVAEDNAPSDPKWFSAAIDHARRDIDALQFAGYDLTNHLGELINGTNVLALHGLNNLSDDSDMLLVPELTATVVSPSAEIGYITTPSPGTANVGNSEVFSAYVSETRINVEPGFFDEPFDVTVRTETPAAVIRYTTDGKSPTATSGLVYSGPIHIDTTTTLRVAAFKDDYVSSNVDTRSFLFLQDVIRQPRDPLGFPAAWGRSTADYAMDQSIVNDPAYRDEIVDGLTSIRTMSIVMDPEDLFGSNGIYANTSQRGRAWERPGSVEIINPDGSLAYRANSGVRIHGNSSRIPEITAKHSFRLNFRDQYGPKKLEYALFPDAPVDRFDNIVLRSGITERDPTFIRDTFARDSARDMGKVDGHATFVHLYLNGLYWGLYNPLERADAQMAEEYFGGSDEDYDALHFPSDRTIDGDDRRYEELLAFDGSGLSVDEAYAQIQRYVHVDNLIDFLLLRQYVGGGEFRVIGSRVNDAMFRFFVWDMEGSLSSPPNISLNLNPVNDAGFTRLLREHPEFRIRFGDRAHKHLFNGGALTPDAASERWVNRSEELYTAIIAESARWGYRGKHYKRDIDWQRELDRVLEQYFPLATELLVEALRTEDLYPSIAAPRFNQHGGSVATGFELRIENPNGKGTLYYTLDGSDPRLVGGGISRQAVAHNGGSIAVPEQVHVKSRVLFDGEWSALNEARFEVQQPDVPQLPSIGDANRDHRFDQRDIVQVLQAGKYGSGEPADWGHGDWNSDWVFNQLDIVVALQTGSYLQ